MEVKLSKDELIQLRDSYVKELNALEINLNAVNYLVSLMNEKIDNYE